MEKYLTAESVTPKHPDKVCDRVSDAILDECLKQDRDSRVAVETMGGHGTIYVTGEITTKAKIRVREVITRIAGRHLGYQENIALQSPDIAKGVDTGGAGDQGIVSGYACRENEEMVPHEFYLARKLCKHLFLLHPEDGKTQVTLNTNTGQVESAVVSFNNVPGDILKDEAAKFFTDLGMQRPSQIFANPAGDWSVGSFDADTGLTGRKLVVDNYGPQIPIGGGAFSGKDCTKVDRTGAYFARFLACDLLNKYPDVSRTRVKLAFSIGVPKPVMQTATHQVLGIDGYVDTEYEIPETFLISDMIKFLDLRSPIFEKTAEWGAFGNGFKWDALTK